MKLITHEKVREMFSLIPQEAILIGVTLRSALLGTHNIQMYELKYIMDFKLNFSYLIYMMYIVYLFVSIIML